MKSENSVAIEREYLVFLQNLYLVSQSLTREAIKWLLGEMAYTISNCNPELSKAEIVALLINLQKLKRKDEKKVEI